jgi:two-component system sensor histidine kinase YesM
LRGVSVKKKAFTFVEKAIVLIITLAILFGIQAVLLLGILYKVSDIKWQGIVIITFLTVLVIAGLGILIKKWIFTPYLDYKNLFKRFINAQIYQELLNKSSDIFPGMEEVLLRFDKVIDKQKVIQLSTKQAEFLALQNQINPHFLYNTLEAIRGDALCAGMDNIADITEALSTFFRYTITETGSLVTLAEELDNVDNYFRIQKYRFGEKLEMVYEFSENEAEILQLPCPKLTFQPIIENAIFHGLEKKAEGGTVRVEIELSDNKVLISIKDNGVGIEEEALGVINEKLEHISIAHIEENKNKKGGIALRNVCRRIKLLFGEEYGIHIYSLPGIGTDVRIMLPVLKKERDFNDEGRINSY